MRVGGNAKIRYINEKETLRQTRQLLQDFRAVLQFTDKRTLDSIAQNMFDDDSIHFDDLIHVNSGIIKLPDKHSTFRITEAQRYMNQKEKRMRFIEEIVNAIYDLKLSNNTKVFDVMIYRYVYGYTIEITAEQLNEEPRNIRRLSLRGELAIAPALNTVAYK